MLVRTDDPSVAEFMDTWPVSTPKPTPLMGSCGGYHPSAPSDVSPSSGVRLSPGNQFASGWSSASRFGGPATEARCRISRAAGAGGRAGAL